LILLSDVGLAYPRRYIDHRKIYSREKFTVGSLLSETAVRLALVWKVKVARIARLAMRQPRELLAVAEQKFDLETGDVVPVQGDRIEIEVSTEQDGHTTVVAVGHHHDPARRAVGEEPSEALPQQSLAFDQATLFVGNRQFENRLCQVNSDGGSVHGWAPPAR